MIWSRDERFNDSVDSTKSIGFYSSATTSLINQSYNVYATKSKSPRGPHRPDGPNSSSGKYNRSPRAGRNNNNNNRKANDKRENSMLYTAAELAQAASPVYNDTHNNGINGGSLPINNNRKRLANLQFGSSLENDDASLGGTGIFPKDFRTINIGSAYTNDNYNQSSNQNYNNMNVGGNIFLNHNASEDTSTRVNLMGINGYTEKEVRDATRSFFKVVENAERISTRPTCVITSDKELTELEEFEEFDAMQKKLEEDERRGRMAGAFSRFLRESMEKRLAEEALEAEELALDEECEEKAFLEILENTIAFVLEKDLATMIAMERGLYLVTEEFLLNTQVLLMDEIIFEAIECFKKVDMSTQTDIDATHTMTTSSNYANDNINQYKAFESSVLSAASSMITLDMGTQSHVVSPAVSIFDINAPDSDEEEEEEEDGDIYGVEFSDTENKEEDDDDDDEVFNINFD